MSDAPSIDAASLLQDGERLVAALGAVPMLAGMSDDELLELGETLTPVELAAGEVLWRQATPVDGLLILLSGEVRTFRRLPGEREFEVARVGPGTVFGGILLLGGGIRMATARAATSCSLLFLPGEDFHARMQLGRPSALRLKRRILENTCARIRGDHALISSSLASAAGREAGRIAPGRGARCERPTAMPAPAYAARLPFFTGMPAAMVFALLASGDAVWFAPGCVIVEEGETASRCFVVLSGAVEDVVQRDGRVIRVRFAGPGKASCYLSFFDGKPASVTSVARERTVALAVPADDFQARLHGSDDLSRAFTAAIEADLWATLHSTTAPKAYLAAAGA